MECGIVAENLWNSHSNTYKRFPLVQKYGGYSWLIKSRLSVDTKARSYQNEDKVTPKYGVIAGFICFCVLGSLNSEVAWQHEKKDALDALSIIVTD